MLAKLRIEMKGNNFMLTKIIDINSGVIIPVKSVTLDMDIEHWSNGVMATIVVPVEELELDGILTKIVTYDVRPPRAAKGEIMSAIFDALSAGLEELKGDRDILYEMRLALDALHKCSHKHEDWLNRSHQVRVAASRLEKAVRSRRPNQRCT